METIIRTKLVDTYYGAPLVVEWECPDDDARCVDDASCVHDPDLDGPDDDTINHYWQ